MTSAIKFLVRVHVSCFSTIALCATASSADHPRQFTVKDSIEMSIFVDPQTRLRGEGGKVPVRPSPDGKYFAVVTQRGLTERNELESTLWIFDAESVRRWVESPSDQKKPTPKQVARIATRTNDPAIMEVKWADEDHIAFLARTSGGRRLYVADVRTHGATPITPTNQDVLRFDARGRAYAYAAATPNSARGQTPKDATVESAVVATGRDLSQLLFPELFDQSQETTATLWVIRDNRRFAVTDKKTGRAVTLPVICVADFCSVLAISPDGRSIVMNRRVTSVPKAWEAYEPGTFGKHLKETKAGEKPASAGSLLPETYAVLDVDTGRVQALDAPTGPSLERYGPIEATWVGNRRDIVLSNTFLPLDSPVEAERIRLRAHPCVAIWTPDTGRIKCVTELKPYNPLAEESLILASVSYREADRNLVVDYKKFRGSTFVRIQREAYQLDLNSPSARPIQPSNEPIDLSLYVCQELNQPPRVFVRSSNSDLVELWDPNPQLRDIGLGEASEFNWRDRQGNQWHGGLVLPPDYKKGQQYPLIVQSHGFVDHEFLTDGTFTTAFAARPLAAAGFVVLQVQDITSRDMTPEEAPLQLAGYEAAIDTLVKDGFVDPQRVGIIGFSRTVYYTLYALTHAPDRFAAATVADGVFYGYMQYLIGVGDGSLLRYDNDQIGSAPFGEGLKKWLAESPGFLFDKIAAPVRVEVHNRQSLLGDWEVYAALYAQRKPVDLIMLPDATHEVAKPKERIESQQGDVDWFRFWLQGYEDRDPRKTDQYSRWRDLRKLKENEVNRQAASPN